jgi:hypothetical protein
MAKTSKTVQSACRLLKQRVRYESARLRLPGSSFDDDDTLKIRLATKIYVNTWILPLLDAIESGNTVQLRGLL